MKKKKVMVVEREKVIFNENGVIIYENGGNLIFEIGSEITEDIAEAVAILMRIKCVPSSVWDIELTGEEWYNIDSYKSLYWLSGGKEEWDLLENYKYNWNECYAKFVEEFDTEITKIVRRSEKLGDIKIKFMHKLNLPVLYDFAISEGFVR